MLRSEGSWRRETRVRHFRWGWRAFKRQLDDPEQWTDEHLHRLVVALEHEIRSGIFVGRDRDLARAICFQFAQVRRLAEPVRARLATLTGMESIDEIRQHFLAKDHWHGKKAGYTLQRNGNEARRMFRKALQQWGDHSLRRFHGVAPIGTLGWFTPRGAAGLAGLVAAAIAGHVLLSAEGDRTLSRAHLVLQIETPQGKRIVLGFSDGGWAIAGPDGHIEYSAPARLHLPGPAEFIAAGDLDGDRQPELAFVLAPGFDRGIRPASWREVKDGTLPYRPQPNGVWLFTLADNGGWQLLDVVPGHIGAVDVDACRDTLIDHLAANDEMARTGLFAITDELERARRSCPSRMRKVELRPGVLIMYLHAYGRAIARARCGSRGCQAAELVAVVDSDILGAAHVRDAAGRKRSLISTGCWRENGPLAYGLLEVDPTRSEKPIELLYQPGGRTFVKKLDEHRMAILNGQPCSGLREQRLVASMRDAPPGVAEGTLIVATLDEHGALEHHDRVLLPNCCRGDHIKMVVVPDAAGQPLALAVSYDEIVGQASSLLVFDVRRDLDDQTPVVIPPPFGPATRLFTLSAADINGDEKPELMVSHVLYGTVAFELKETANCLRLRRRQLW